MLRSDRLLVEKLFGQGLCKVLVCTATLAWGINLPAHTVIIRGTQIYNAEKGGFVDLGMLDVMQIFGRAGRPQFDKSGEGIIITSHENLDHYLALLSHQLPIESQFTKRLADHLNAEIVLGTVTNVREAVTWLSYTYMYIRMLKNPLVYGISYEEKMLDPNLEKARRELIDKAARSLDISQMIRFNEMSGTLAATSLGRVASHYYIQNESMSIFGTDMQQNVQEADIVGIICQSSEFQNIKVREEEMTELDMLRARCTVPFRQGMDQQATKINILFQSFISKVPLDSFTLISDCAYIAQNASRILRGLFEMVHKRGWSTTALKLLTLCKMADRQFRNFT
ncbi:activating signal cointegrator 1 complex subunit 3 [Pelomyxa schiedti]|nr:activating signal cointegrator 1 complex subunit 3 [Pelomyxa schiedti]